MAVEVKIPHGPLYVDMDGFRLGRTFLLEEFRSALKYQPRADDNFLVTFPKCGATWTTHIAYLLFNDGIPAEKYLDFYRTCPFLEKCGAEYLLDMNRPGLIKTHLPYRLIPKHPEAKYIYVCRNPKDACVSFFYHTRTHPAYDFMDGTFDAFFEVFMAGENEHGDYFDHVLSWYAHRDDPNVLFIHYEDMKRDPKDSILKIAAFLGDQPYKALLENHDVLQNVIKYSDIAEMQKYTRKYFADFMEKPLSENNLPRALRITHRSEGSSSHFNILTRKGVVGDWRAHFTPEMSTRMEQKIRDLFSGTDMIHVWKEHGVI